MSNLCRKSSQKSLQKQQIRANLLRWILIRPSLFLVLHSIWNSLWEICLMSKLSWMRLKSNIWRVNYIHSQNIKFFAMCLSIWPKWINICTSCVELNLVPEFIFWGKSALIFEFNVKIHWYHKLISFHNCSKIPWSSDQNWYQI